MTPATLLHRLKPNGYGDFHIANQLRNHARELQDYIDKAHAELAKIYAPSDLGKNDLVDWAGHEPFQIEYFEGARGDCELVNIRVRGVVIPEDYLGVNIWLAAQAEVENWKEAKQAEATEAQAERRADEARELAD